MRFDHFSFVVFAALAGGAGALVSPPSSFRVRRAALAPVRPSVRPLVSMVAPEKGNPKRRAKKKPAGPPVKKFKLAPSPEIKTEEELEDVPMFRVVLLGDESYDKRHVCKSLVEIVEDVKQMRRAEELFQTAQQVGSAIVTVVPQEIAEHYVEQLQRREPMIMSEMQDDKVDDGM